MNDLNDIELWRAQITRWKEQAEVLTKRMETRRIMFTSAAIGQQQFEMEHASLEADRAVYLNAIAAAEARVRSISGRIREMVAA